MQGIQRGLVNEFDDLPSFSAILGKHDGTFGSHRPTALLIHEMDSVKVNWHFAEIWLDKYLIGGVQPAFIRIDRLLYSLAYCLPVACGLLRPGFFIAQGPLFGGRRLGIFFNLYDVLIGGIFGIGFARQVRYPDIDISNREYLFSTRGVFGCFSRLLFRNPHPGNTGIR